MYLYIVSAVYIQCSMHCVWFAIVPLCAVDAALQALTMGRGTPYSCAKQSLPGGIVIELDGVQRFESLPTTGKLHETTEVFAKHARPPEGRETPITLPWTRDGMYGDAFVYMGLVHEASCFTWVNVNETSATTCVFGTNGVVVQSSFDDDADGWRVGSTSSVRMPVSANWSYTRSGAMNRFIWGRDTSIDLRKGVDVDEWYFEAPPKFLGNQAFANEFSFTLKAFSGAAQCGESRVRAIARFESGPRVFLLSGIYVFSMRPQTWTISFTEGCIRPAMCGPPKFLRNLTSLHIFGDLTHWYEDVGLDNVVFRRSN